MRARFLQALAQPLEDIKTVGRKLEGFHRPVTVVRAIEAKADVADRALETISLGLALAEMCVSTGDGEDEP